VSDTLTAKGGVAGKYERQRIRWVVVDRQSRTVIMQLLIAYRNSFAEFPDSFPFALFRHVTSEITVFIEFPEDGYI
jgi:hypothetical protein